MTPKKKTFLVTITFLWVFWVIGIFYFSSQSPSTSSAQSSFVTRVMIRIDTVLDYTSHPLYKRGAHFVRHTLFQGRFRSKDTLVRKSAHFGIYFVLGFISTLFGFLYTKRFFIAGILGITVPVTIAVLDEYNQGQIGRGGSLSDVIIDGYGALSGTILMLFFLLLLHAVGLMKNGE